VIYLFYYNEKHIKKIIKVPEYISKMVIKDISNGYKKLLFCGARKIT
jgi:hypothetical protein